MHTTRKQEVKNNRVSHLAKKCLIYERKLKIVDAQRQRQTGTTKGNRETGTGTKTGKQTREGACGDREADRQGQGSYIQKKREKQWSKQTERLWSG